MGGMTIDMADFEKGFKQLMDHAAPDELAKGMFKAGDALIKDAIEEKPYAPFDKGDLRGSGRTDEAEVKDGEIEVVAGFNIEYAAWLHEMFYGIGGTSSMYPPTWTLPGSGPKYLESKMCRNSKRYLDIVGEHLKRVLGG